MDCLTPSARLHQNTVSVANLRAFNPERGECCTASNFRLNLEGTSRDDWNTSATRVFVNDFLRKHTGYPAENQVVRSAIWEKTAAAIKSLIQSYRRKDLSAHQRRAAQKRRNRRERKRTVEMFSRFFAVPFVTLLPSL